MKSATFSAFFPQGKPLDQFFQHLLIGEFPALGSVNHDKTALFLAGGFQKNLPDPPVELQLFSFHPVLALAPSPRPAHSNIQAQPEKKGQSRVQTAGGRPVQDLQKVKVKTPAPALVSQC